MPELRGASLGAMRVTADWGKHGFNRDSGDFALWGAASNEADKMRYSCLYVLHIT